MLNVFVIAFGLAMDSFSASLVLGGNISNNRHIATRIFISSIFGLFHIGMLTLGLLIGETFGSFISGVDHWIAFLLLTIVGMRMFLTTMRDGIKSIAQERMGIKLVLSLALATSIDALILGMGIVFMGLSILLTVITIGIVVFLLSLVGFYLGLRGNRLLDNKVGAIGGGILILMGIKILIEHLIL
jgi:putative Mn2+ efflux pump MntP